METGLYSVASIKNHLLSNIKPKNDICLIFYLKEVGRSDWNTGLVSVDLKLERKAIPVYLKEEFLKRHGMGIRIPENDVLKFIEEYNINISEEQIDNLIKRNYA